MIHLYYRNDGRLLTMDWEEGMPYPADVIWADLDNTSPGEEGVFQACSGIILPSREDEWKNEVLNRMYQDGNLRYMTASIISKNEGPHPVTCPITFVLSEECLVTLRDIHPTSCQQFAKRLLKSSKDFISGPEVLEGLLSEMVTRIAHNSELVMTELDELSHLIFDPYGLRPTKGETDAMRQLLQRLGASADLNSKIGESLHSFARLLTFFKEGQEDNKYLMRKLDLIAADIQELMKQAGFLSDKITFQLDACLGMINVEQNIIMKILSVFTVVIMPPTLIGSIYGMNFHDMPELSSPWGYPSAMVLMLVCGTAPYFFFRYKKWL